MPRYGYYDSEVQPKEPIDELSTGGQLPEPLDADFYERPAEAFDPEHEGKGSRHKAGARA